MQSTEKSKYKGKKEDVKLPLFADDVIVYMAYS